MSLVFVRCPDSAAQERVVDLGDADHAAHAYQESDSVQAYHVEYCVGVSATVTTLPVTRHRY